MGTHQLIDQEKGIHSPYRWQWDDATARLAETDVTQDDVDNATVGLQKSDNVMYRATSPSPSVSWTEVGGSTSPGTGTFTVINSDVDEIDTALNTVHRVTAPDVPSLGFGASVNYRGSTDATLTGQEMGETGFAWADPVEPDQRSVFVLIGYAGITKIPIALISAMDITPQILNDVIANLGSGAVDLHVQKESDVDTAVGNGSFVIGGRAIKTDAPYSGILAGQENRADGENAIAMGYGAAATFENSFAQAAGYESFPGDNNVIRIPIRGETVDNTPLQLGQNFNIPTNSGFGFSLSAAAVNIETPGQSAFYKRRGYGRVGASIGTLVLSGVATEGVDQEDDAAWDITVQADSGTNSIYIEVTGDATDTLHWNMMFELIVVS